MSPLIRDSRRVGDGLLGIDADAHMDVVGLNGKGSGEGTQLFSEKSQTLVPAAADFNPDGRAEIVATPA